MHPDLHVAIVGDRLTDADRYAMTERCFFRSRVEHPLVCAPVSEEEYQRRLKLPEVAKLLDGFHKHWLNPGKPETQEERDRRIGSVPKVARGKIARKAERAKVRRERGADPNRKWSHRHGWVRDLKTGEWRRPS